MGTKYACNVYDFLNDFPISRLLWRKLKTFGQCRHIWSPSGTIACIYGPGPLVPITVIESIFGPLFNQDCRHIWSPFSLRWQAYLVSNEIFIAGIFGTPDTLAAFQNVLRLLSVINRRIRVRVLNFMTENL